MRDGSDFRNQMCATGEGQFDMAHPVAPHLGERHFHAAFFADDAFILHPLVFAAETFIVLDRTENPRAEKAVPLRLERAVIYCLWLLNLAI